MRASGIDPANNVEDQTGYPSADGNGHQDGMKRVPIRAGRLGDGPLGRGGCDGCHGDTSLLFINALPTDIPKYAEIWPPARLHLRGGRTSLVEATCAEQSVHI